MDMSLLFHFVSLPSWLLHKKQILQKVNLLKQIIIFWIFLFHLVFSVVILVFRIQISVQVGKLRRGFLSWPRFSQPSVLWRIAVKCSSITVIETSKILVYVWFHFWRRQNWFWHVWKFSTWNWFWLQSLF